MSGTSIAKKVNKAMGKVGSKLGFPCNIYRPENYTNPLQDKNLVATGLVAFSVDETFVRNPVDELAHYKVYVGTDRAQVGDILVFDDKTIVVTEMEPIRTPTGILTNDLVNIYRPVPTPTLPNKITLSQLFEGVPCAIKIKSASSFNTPNVATSVGTTNIEMWTWMPANQVFMSDVIEWNGSRFTINSVNATVKGTKVTATSNKKGA